jgi:hypothetical protein
MGQDTPDWGGLYNNAIVFPLFDMAELAARLGSPVVYDRRGAVLWVEDFTYGLGGMTANHAGDGAAVELAASNFFRGPFCCRMVSGSELNSFATIYKDLPLPSLSNFGVSCLATIGTGVDVMSFYAGYDDGLSAYEAYLIISQLDNKVYIATPTGNVEIAPGSSPLARLDAVWYLKLVIDPISLTYVRAVVNDTEIDLSGYDLYKSATRGYKHLAVTVYLQNLTGGLGGQVFVDDLILTYAEPASE